ncbi:hypothetical protein [Neisseria sicca]|uniref:hypothetical protein n=1 Tax=Neisseria sicca TaxID=490 RepID=UPI00031EF52C|nr:hypothetical protein [Neisseria sicca]
MVIAIKHEIEDEITGAVASHHVIEYVSIDYKYGSATATLNGYVSQKAYEAGRNPLCSHSIAVNVLPEEGEVSRAWLYGKAVEQENEQSVFSGAELVEA